MQTLSEITGENDWFSGSFAQFNVAATKLPFDHHMLMGMVAPRGLLAIDNTGIDWLTAPSSWGGEQAGQMIYQSLGVPVNLGASQVSHGDHCAFQASQQPEVDAFIKKFLLGQDVAIDVDKTDGPAFDQSSCGTVCNSRCTVLHAPQGFTSPGRDRESRAPLPSQAASWGCDPGHHSVRARVAHMDLPRLVSAHAKAGRCSYWAQIQIVATSASRHLSIRAAGCASTRRRLIRRRR